MVRVTDRLVSSSLPIDRIWMRDKSILVCAGKFGSQKETRERNLLAEIRLQAALRISNFPRQMGQICSSLSGTSSDRLNCLSRKRHCGSEGSDTVLFIAFNLLSLPVLFVCLARFWTSPILRRGGYTWAAKPPWFPPEPSAFTSSCSTCQACLSGLI